MNDTAQSYTLSEDSSHWIFEDGRSIPRLAGGDDGEGSPVPAQPAEGGDDQAPESTPTPSTADAKGRGPAPWAKDIQAINEADDPVQWVDEYLRTQWQPRMTQHEQSVKTYTDLFGDEQNAQAVAQFLMGLDSDPKSVLQFLSQQYKVDPLDLIEELFDDGSSGKSDEQPDGSDDDPMAQFKALLDQDPRIQHSQQAMESQTEQEQNAALEELLGDLDAHFTNKKDVFNRDLFVRMLVSENGDADAAFEAYEQFHVPQTPDDPPPTGGASKGVTPEPAKEFGSIKEAVAAFASDRRLGQS